MRKTGLFFALALCVSLPACADEAMRNRVAQYFTGWYSVCPGTKVTVSPAEVSFEGYETFRTERTCDLKNRNESNTTLVSKARNEIFVGQVLHDDARADRPFSADVDLPAIRGALAEAFGLPIAVSVAAGSRGPLLPLEFRIQQAPGVAATLPGFVSKDGASILLGEFFPLDVAPDTTREKLIAGSDGTSKSKAAFTVTAFIDFQCEKCRVRTPQVRDFATAHGGGVRVRYLPLVKIHDWSFAAAESAAALESVSPALALKYEEAVFPKAASMNEKAARDLAADIAEAAGNADAFAAALASGRARQRVLTDINLALRLGLNTTPVFFYRGAWLTSEPDLAETYIQSRLARAAKPAGKGSSR